MINNGTVLLIKPVDGQWPTFVYQGADVLSITIKMRGLSELNLSAGWARRTYYVDNLRNSMTGARINQPHEKRFSNGLGNFYIESSFVYDMRANNILLMGVGSRAYVRKDRFGLANMTIPKIIYVSEEFDTPRVDYRVRSVRSTWRQAMSVAKDRGIRVEKIPQKEINRFIAHFNYQPDTLHLDNIEANMKAQGIGDLFGSLRTVR